MSAHLVTAKKYLDALIADTNDAIDFLADIARERLDVVTLEHGQDLAASCVALDPQLPGDLRALLSEGDESAASQFAYEHLGAFRAADPAAFENAPTKIALFHRRCAFDDVAPDRSDWRWFEIDRMGVEELRREAYRISHGERVKARNAKKKVATQ